MVRLGVGLGEGEGYVAHSPRQWAIDLCVVRVRE